jgi:hypothetical protein
MSCSCCQCSCRRSDVFARMSLRMSDDLRKNPRTRSREVFAIRPRRCPKTKKWYWLRRIWIVEKGVICHQVFAWGVGVLPYLAWEREQIWP